MKSSVNYNDIYDLVTSKDWQSYKVDTSYKFKGKTLTPADITAAVCMSIVVYDTKFSANDLSSEDRKQCAIKYAQNPHLYTNVTSLTKDTCKK